MSMRLAVNCPFCKRPMATSAAFAGQMIACPSCRGEFVLHSPALAPPAEAVPPPAPAAPVHRLESSPADVATAAAVAAAPPVAPPTPPQTANTARFKTAASTAPAFVATADGKLPALQLADAKTAAAKGETGEKAVPLWLAV